MEENKEVEVVKEVKEEEKVQVEIVDKKDDEILEKEDSVEEERVEGEEDKDEDEDKGSSISSLLEEREEGDGEEEEKEKKLDDDEDKRNPQYIPKKGNFYEHDDRMGEEEVESEPAKVEEEGKEKKKKGKVWEEVERWGHDMYNETEQSPKSTRELIDAYGYDIRSEEGPPKARRRRRYGKGQNKYQRSWEDESAYVKTSSFSGRKPRNFVKKDEDFPELPGKRDSSKVEAKVTKKVQISDEVTEIDEQIEAKGRTPSLGGRGGRGGRGGNYSGRGRFKAGTGRVQPSTPPSLNKNIKKSDQDDIATLAQHFSEAVINIDKNIIPRVPPKEDDKTKSPNADTPKKASPVLPQQQIAQENRPKRYSAQRQRSLPQSSSTHSSQQSPQPFIQQTQPQQAIQHANYYQAPPPQQQHVEQPPVTQNYPGMQMVTFLPPPPHPPPAQPAYAPQPPPIYVPQQFIASPPPLAVQPPTEVYQGGGITYYSTQTQMANHAQLPRRVNLAIPIVHPGEQPEP